MPSLEERKKEESESLPVTVVLNGHDKNGNGLKIVADDTQKHDLVLKVFRCLIADLCEQFKGGHPGYVNVEVVTFSGIILISS